MISFGTSGWRGIIAEDFTFATVRAVARAIADHLLGPGAGGRGWGLRTAGGGRRTASR